MVKRSTRIAKADKMEKRMDQMAKALAESQARRRREAKLAPSEKQDGAAEPSRTEPKQQ